MTFTMCTVTRLYVEPDGAATPATGQVTFTPSATMVNAAITLPTIPQTVVLDATGRIGIALPATVDAGTTPSGVTYEVYEDITGAGARSYRIQVPAQATANLADLVVP